MSDCQKDNDRCIETQLAEDRPDKPISEAELFVEILCGHSRALRHMSYTGDQPDMREDDVDRLRKLLDKTAAFIYRNYEALIP